MTAGIVRPRGGRDRVPVPEREAGHSHGHRCGGGRRRQMGGMGSERTSREKDRGIGHLRSGCTRDPNRNYVADTFPRARVRGPGPIHVLH